MNHIFQKGAISFIALVVFVLFFISGAYYFNQIERVTPNSQVSFETEAECEEASGKSCEPWMCDFVPEGKTFEEVCPDGSIGWSPVQDKGDDSEVTRQINTSIGILELHFTEDKSSDDLAPRGTLTLAGTLDRGTPCVNWEVNSMMTMDYPTSNITIEIENTDSSGVCIQVVGEPQEINFPASSIARLANINILLEGESIFSGTLSSGENTQYGELTGMVNIGPICPVESNPPQQGCKPTPELFSQVKITAKSIDGKIESSTTPGPGGFYFLRLPTGKYLISIESPLGIGGTNQVHPVTISMGGIAELDVSIDTGIR